MKIRLTVDVPVVSEGEYDHPEDISPIVLENRTRDIERQLPPSMVVVKSEFLPEVEDAKALFKKLLRFKLEMSDALPKDFKKSDYYEKGDEEAPFYSEAILYNLIGKEDARTVLAYLHSLMRFNGLDPLKVEREVNAEIAAEEEAEKKRKALVEGGRKFRAAYAKEKGWPKTDTPVGLSHEHFNEAQKAWQNSDEYKKIMEAK